MKRQRIVFCLAVTDEVPENPEQLIGMIEEMARFDAGLARNPRRAEIATATTIRFFSKAAESGSVESMQALARIYNGKHRYQGYDAAKHRN